MTSLRLIAVGDIWLQTQNNRDPFERIKIELKNKDTLFGNLETVLSTKGKMMKKPHVLFSPPDHVKYLKEAGFDVVNIANNHSLDLGIDGFINTLDVLNNNDILFVGGNKNKESPRHAIIEKNGIKLGFLAYASGHFKIPDEIVINKLKENEIAKDIKDIKDDCDFTIISLHWGTENVFYPSPTQIKLAHSLIDHGAYLILGHHPHVVQAIEKYNEGLIAYSLGNFQFNTKRPYCRTNKTMMLCVDFDKTGIKNYKVIPCNIDQDFIPFVVERSKKENILSFIESISDKVSSRTITKSWWFEQIAEEYLSGNMNSYKYRIKNHGIFPLIECIVWLATPFNINCYLGIIRKRLKKSWSEEQT